MSSNIFAVKSWQGAVIACMAAGSLAVPGHVMAASAAQQGRPTGNAAAALKDLPPLSYVCVMPGDEDVIDDKPGNCPKCKMALVPVRLDAKWWCPVHQSLEVHDGPGKCRRDGRDLVQVTVSESWICGDAPDTKHLEPGNCADGSPRRIKYEIRAHGDHNPRHGGQFFMASDAWHHVEGTYPSAGLFRLYFYDNFTKPLAAAPFSGTVVIRDASDKQIASAPLTSGPVTNTLEAKIPTAQAALPLRATAMVKFSASGKEQPFDFQFNEYSKDLASSAGLTQPASSVARERNAHQRWRQSSADSSILSVRSAPAVFRIRTAGEPMIRTRDVALTQASPTQSQAPTPSAQPPDLFGGEIAPMPPALAAVIDESVLPKTIPGLLAELRKREAEVDKLVKDGNLGEVWLPAMGTKTVALVLSDHAGELAPAKRAEVTTAARRVVASTWLIDGYGDLGNRTKMVEAYNELASSINDLEGAYRDAQ